MLQERSVVFSYLTAVSINSHEQTNEAEKTVGNGVKMEGLLTVCREIGTIETDRLKLIPITRDLAEEMFEVQQDPTIYEFISDDPLNKEELFNKYVTMEPGFSPDSPELLWWNWAIHRKADGEYLGWIEVARWPDEPPFLAYFLKQSARRTGVATEACSRIMQTVQTHLGVNSFMAEVDTRNEPSIRLLQKLGFRLSETIRDVEFFKGSSSSEQRFFWNAEENS